MSLPSELFNRDMAHHIIVSLLKRDGIEVPEDIDRKAMAEAFVNYMATDEQLTNNVIDLVDSFFEMYSTSRANDNSEADWMQEQNAEKAGRRWDHVRFMMSEDRFWNGLGTLKRNL